MSAFDCACRAASLGLVLAAAIVTCFVGPNNAAGIGCFKCASENGSNPACDDPFHNNYTDGSYYERPCMGGRKNRNGLFPASSCIKMTGFYRDGSGKMTVRGCALDSGTLTTDTEIIRMSHCGSFYFNEKYVHGCVQSCDDADGCNGATQQSLGSPSAAAALRALLALLALLFPLWHSQRTHLSTSNSRPLSSSQTWE